MVLNALLPRRVGFKIIVGNMGGVLFSNSNIHNNRFSKERNKESSKISKIRGVISCE